MRKAMRGAMTPAEMRGLKVGPGWDDGREGFLYCRLDAVLDRERGLGAELTWNDDSEWPDNERGVPRVYYDPELFIETRGRGRFGETVMLDGWRVELSGEEAVTLAEEGAALVLEKYADRIAALKVRPKE